VRRLVAEYGDADKGEFAKALQGITRKLGGQHYNAAMEQLRNNNMSEVIDIILNYYDKAYGNSMERKKERVKLTIEWDGSSVDKIAKSLINEADELEKQEIKIFNGKER
jgi:tRNA 2-selenouridine synthase